MCVALSHICYSSNWGLLHSSWGKAPEAQNPGSVYHCQPISLSICPSLLSLLAFTSFAVYRERDTHPTSPADQPGTRETDSPWRLKVSKPRGLPDPPPQGSSLQAERGRLLLITHWPKVLTDTAFLSSFPHLYYVHLRQVVIHAQKVRKWEPDLEHI